MLMMNYTNAILATLFGAWTLDLIFVYIIKNDIKICLFYAVYHIINRRKCATETRIGDREHSSTKTKRKNKFDR